MLRHYLTITRRLLTREKGYALINITGLILGLTAVLLAVVFIRDELGYDQFHSKSERIFRINKWVTDPGGDRFRTAESPGLMAPTMVADFPEITEGTHILPWFDEVLMTYQDQNVSTSGFTFADTSFFEVFDFRVLRGNGREALRAPGQVLLTPKLAAALFGDEDPIGKAVSGVSDQPFTVAGIIEAPPRNSHIQFEALASWSSTVPQIGSLGFSFMNNWLGQTVYSYVVLQEAKSAAAVNEKLPAFVGQYMPNRTDVYEFYLQPLEEIYLHSYDLRYLHGNKYGSFAFLRTFTIIAVLILLVACFNYINISTAKSINRGREMGVKKVLGARRGQLLGQFLMETLTFVAFAGLLSLILANHLLPLLNDFFGKDLPASLLFEPGTLIYLTGAVVLTTFGAGLFPGLIISGLRPLGMLRNGKMTDTPKTAWPRQVLTGVQLALSIGLIAGTILLNQQFRFLLDQDLGFDKEQVLVMNTPPGVLERAGAFRNLLEQQAGIESVSMCQAAVGTGTFGTTIMPRKSDEELQVQAFRVDTQFIETYGMELAAGRFFSARFPADTSYGSVVVNEELVRRMGLEDPVGQMIRFGPDDPGTPIVGVVRDFHYASFHEPIGPVVMWLDNRIHNISVRVDKRRLGELLPFLEKTWMQFEPRYAFHYYFVDQFFAENYQAEQQMLSILSAFSVIAILIACLGLYGLASFTVSRRIKEIGIRKVLGAGTGAILVLLHRQLFYLTLLAFGAVTPLAYFFLKRWLERYAYAVEIRPWIFIAAGMLTLVIAGVAVLFQSLRAAQANPVKALRYE